MKVPKDAVSQMATWGKIPIDLHGKMLEFKAEKNKPGPKKRAKLLCWEIQFYFN